MGTVKMMMRIMILGSVFTIINENLARHVVATDEFFFWIRRKRTKIENVNTPIAIAGKKQSSITINDCNTNPTHTSVAKDIY